jgi:acyl dehydratase
VTTAIAPDVMGAEAGPLTQAVDARWLMAYAAALGETDARYFDTLAVGGPLAHPLFPVCYEWPVAVLLRDRTLDVAVQPQGVHATHDLTIHRAPRAGDTLATAARVVHVEPRRAGTLIVTRFETTDAAGRAVTTTDYGSIYRGVPLAGADGVGPRPATSPRPEPPGTTPPPREQRPEVDPSVRWQERVAVAANAAWVYTECARIWNPIHTDLAVARAAGLRAPILHGTATLALAVSRVIARDLGGDASGVRAVRGRFSGMVAMPSSLTVRGRAATGDGIAFDAVAADGTPVLTLGVVIP